MNTSMSVAGKLIKHVKQHPILYDSSDVDYRNNEKKDQLWETIAEDLKENVMDVKKRWRNLRDTYVKLLKLVKGGEKDPVFEAAAIRKYHKWVWTKEMEFFRSHFTYGNQMNLDPSEIPRPPTPPQRATRSSTTDALKKKSIKRERELSTSPTRLRKFKSKKLFKSIKPLEQLTLLSKTERTTNSMITGIAAKDSLSPNTVAQKLTSTELDATDRLFLAHAQNIKQFTARRQALTKLKIAEVIMEQEILHQEDMELASISATTARIISKNSSSIIRDESPQPFESVCGYASEDGDMEDVCQTKMELTAENPVDFDSLESEEV